MPKPLITLTASNSHWVINQAQEADSSKGQKTLHLILSYLQQICLYERPLAVGIVTEEGNLGRQLKQSFELGNTMAQHLAKSIYAAEQVVATITGKEGYFHREQ